MFDLVSDAVEMNSICSFCKRTKFHVQATDSGKFDLVRCDQPNCTEHCHWDHPPVETTLQTANMDTVSIVSGW